MVPNFFGNIAWMWIWIRYIQYGCPIINHDRVLLQQEQAQLNSIVGKINTLFSNTVLAIVIMMWPS